MYELLLPNLWNLNRNSIRSRIETTAHYDQRVSERYWDSIRDHKKCKEKFISAIINGYVKPCFFGKYWKVYRADRKVYSFIFSYDNERDKLVLITFMLNKWKLQEAITEFAYQFIYNLTRRNAKS